jgi:hypothetical protein
MVGYLAGLAVDYHHAAFVTMLGRILRNQLFG